MFTVAVTGYQLEILPLFNSKHKGRKDLLLYLMGSEEEKGSLWYPGAGLAFS